MSELTELLEDATVPAFITHQGADRDSLGSALGLQAIRGAGTICTPTGISKPARGLREIADTAIVEGHLPSEYDQVIVLDAPSSARISPVDPDSLLLIDHHDPADLARRAEASLVDTNAGATAELIARLAAEAGWNIPADAALPLLVGLLGDTGGFRTVGPQTATAAASLFEAVGDRATALPELLDRSVERDERIAGVVGVLRATGYRAGDLIVATSKVRAHEATAAARLRSSGADHSIVCSKQPEGLRVTARASDHLAERLSLGATMLPALADEFGGDGGGHDAAGSAQLAVSDADAVIEAVFSILESELGMTFSKRSE